MNEQNDTTPLLHRNPRLGGYRASLQGFYAANSGLVLVSLSQLFMCLMGVVVKILNGIDPPVSAIQVVFCRMVITYLFVLSYMLVRKVPHPILGPPEIRGTLMLRGLFGFTNLLAYYSSLQYLTVSDAVTIMFLIPLATGSLASVVLGEVFHIRDILAGGNSSLIFPYTSVLTCFTVVSLFGVLLIARPAFLFDRIHVSVEVNGSHRLLAVGFGLIGVLGAAGAYISIRFMGSRAHTMHSMATFSLVSIMFSGFTMLVTSAPFVVPTNPRWALLLIAIGLLGFVSQMLLTLGIQRQNASKATIGIYTEILWALFFDYLIFGTIPTALSAIGMTVVITSALTVALMKDMPQAARVTEVDTAV